MISTLRLLRAEWRKTIGNLWTLGCVFGVWPALALLVIVFVGGIGLAFEEVRQAMASDLHWDTIILDGWDITSNFIVQFAVLFLGAFIFGGEYRWRTWKNIVPRRSRVSLVLVKYVVLGVLIIISLHVFSAVLTIGFGIVNVLFGSIGSYLQAGEPVSQLATEYIVQVVLVFIGSIFIGATVAFITFLSRSILVGALGGVVILALDGFTPTAVSTVALLTDSDIWVDLLRLRFMYNLHNVGEFLLGRGPASLGLVNFGAKANSFPLSLAIVALWLVIWVGLTLWTFRRQDLTS